MKTISQDFPGDPPESPISQKINEKFCDGTILIGHGKDADLDRTGQCLVTRLEVVDPVGASDMRIDIHLQLYVSICAPSYDNIDLDALARQASPGLMEYFRGKGVDLSSLDGEDDKQVETVAEYFREQAETIICGMDATPDDPFAIMWSDNDAWEGGIDVTLSVSLSLDEYEAIEAGEEGCQEALDAVAGRIAQEISDANKGGTPERDRLKKFAEEVGLANDLIARLECFAQAD